MQQKVLIVSGHTNLQGDSVANKKYHSKFKRAVALIYHNRFGKYGL
ncbi:hypothetical protein [Campylobacter hyointestinalis]|nr:hypothetical protein [Campylobacter hyointestinalis]